MGKGMWVGVDEPIRNLNVWFHIDENYPNSTIHSEYTDDYIAVHGYADGSYGGAYGQYDFGWIILEGFKKGDKVSIDYTWNIGKKYGDAIVSAVTAIDFTGATIANLHCINYSVGNNALNLTHTMPDDGRIQLALLINSESFVIDDTLTINKITVNDTQLFPMARGSVARKVKQPYADGDSKTHTTLRSSDFQSGAYAFSDGVYYDSHPNYVCTKDFIPVTRGSSISIKANGIPLRSDSGFLLYDSSKRYLGSGASIDGESMTCWIDNASYVKLDIAMDGITTANITTVDIEVSVFSGVTRKVKNGWCEINLVARKFFEVNVKVPVTQLFGINNLNPSYVVTTSAEDNGALVLTCKKLVGTGYEGTSWINLNKTIPAGTRVVISTDTLQRPSYGAMQFFYPNSSSTNTYVSGTGANQGQLSNLELTDYTFTMPVTGSIGVILAFWTSAYNGDTNILKITKLIVGDEQII